MNSFSVGLVSKEPDSYRLRALYESFCRGKLTESAIPTGEIIMQRMEVMMRHMDNEAQVLSENSLSFVGLEKSSAHLALLTSFVWEIECMREKLDGSR